MDIPVIDVGGRSIGNTQVSHAFENGLYKAHSTVGFSILVNHGIDGALIDELFLMSEGFHALPVEEKLKVRYGASFRGFLPLNTSTMKKSTLGAARHPNQSESFLVASERDADEDDRWWRSVFGGVQPWPERPLGLAETVARYRSAIEPLGARLIQCFSSALGAPRHALDCY